MSSEDSSYNVVKAMSKGNDPMIQQFQALLHHLQVSCGFHFTMMNADFIKDSGSGKWFLTGIVSYTFDHARMTTINMYPFTLIGSEDPKKWEITLP
jgi:hypothetical protein